MWSRGVGLRCGIAIAGSATRTIVHTILTVVVTKTTWAAWLIQIITARCVISPFRIANVARIIIRITIGVRVIVAIEAVTISVIVIHEVVVTPAITPTVTPAWAVVPATAP